MYVTVGKAVEAPRRRAAYTRISIIRLEFLEKDQRIPLDPAGRFTNGSSASFLDTAGLTDR